MTIPNGSYLYPIIAIHISLVIGTLTYATQDMNQNPWVGLRTPFTLSDPEAWKSGNREVGHTMPFLSAACGFIAMAAFFLPAWRTRFLLLGIVAIQVAALLVLAARWWKPRRQ